jgi:hypothetical protein
MTTTKTRMRIQTTTTTPTTTAGWSLPPGISDGSSRPESEAARGFCRTFPPDANRPATTTTTATTDDDDR